MLSRCLSLEPSYCTERLITLKHAWLYPADLLPSVGRAGASPCLSCRTSYSEPYLDGRSLVLSHSPKWSGSSSTSDYSQSLQGNEWPGSGGHRFMLLAGGVPSLLFPSLEPSSWRFAKSQEVGSSVDSQCPATF